MPLTFPAKYLSFARGDFGILQEEFKWRTVNTCLSEIEPAEIGRSGDRDADIRHIFGDVVHEKITVAGEVTIQISQPSIAFAREGSFRSVQTWAGNMQTQMIQLGIVAVAQFLVRNEFHLKQ